MPAAAGDLNKQVQFTRQGAGAYEPLGDWIWCAYQYERVATIELGLMRLQGRSARLLCRAADLPAGLGPGDRATIAGVGFSILIVKMPTDPWDDVTIEVESAPAAGLVADDFARKGQPAKLRRGASRTAPNFAEATVRAIVTGFKPDELIEDIDQGARQVLIPAGDLAAAGYPEPPVKHDKLIIRGAALDVRSVDADTYRDGGELLVYALVVLGPQVA